MIIVKLFGGLGNQMFQYATGYVFAKKNHADFCLDTSYYHSQGEDTTRSYSLDVFKLESVIANSSFSWWGAWLNQN